MRGGGVGSELERRADTFKNIDRHKMVEKN